MEDELFENKNKKRTKAHIGERRDPFMAYGGRSVFEGWIWSEAATPFKWLMIVIL